MRSQESEMWINNDMQRFIHVHVNMQGTVQSDALPGLFRAARPLPQITAKFELKD